MKNHNNYMALKQEILLANFLLYLLKMKVIEL